MCEQAHRQLKRELGLGHYGGRGWLGLHHHSVPARIAFAFLQHLRLRGKKPGRGRAWPVPRHGRACRALRRHLLTRHGEVLPTCPCCRHCFPFHRRE